MPNYKSIQRKIKNSPKVLKETTKLVRSRFDKEKEIFLTEFEVHPVTQEIQQGPEAGNMSGTLIGYGNLFSFIGFDQGQNPIAPVREMLRKISKIKHIRKAAGTNVKFTINIGIPSLEDLTTVSAMPWEPSKSWLIGIERGMSGLSYYLSASRSSSRSGGGIQTEKRLRVMAFKNVKYMSEMVRNFTRNLRNLK